MCSEELENLSDEFEESVVAEMDVDIGYDEEPCGESVVLGDVVKEIWREKSQSWFQKLLTS